MSRTDANTPPRARHLTGAAKWLWLLAAAINTPAPARLPGRLTAFTLGRMHDEKLTLLDGRIYLKANTPVVGSPPWHTLANGLRRVTRGETPLLTVAFSATSRCPMHCVYCSEKMFGRDVELPTRRLIDLITEAQDLGVFAVDFTGGEPLARDDLPELVAAVDDRSLTLVTTSGFRFPRTSAALREAGLDYVNVSLDTFDAKALARLRGHRDALDIAVTAVRAALNTGFYTSLLAVTDVTTLRGRGFEKYLKAARRLGVHEVRLQMPRPCIATGRERSHGFTEAHRRRQHVLQRHYNGMRDVPTVTSLDHVEGPTEQGCYGGTFYAYVSSNGDVAPCAHFPIVFGNVAERPLAEALATMRRHFPRPPSRCPLPAVHQLIRDVPDDALPVRDQKTIDRVFAALRIDDEPVPAFWRHLGLKRH